VPSLPTLPKGSFPTTIGFDMSGLIFALVFAYGAYRLYHFYFTGRKKIDDESKGSIRMFLFFVLYPITWATIGYITVTLFEESLDKFFSTFIFLLIGVLLYFAFSKIDDDIYKKRD
jgi:hypothetical protein